MSSVPLPDCAGRRSPATMSGLQQGRPPRKKGLRYPPDPPTVEEIIAVMRTAGDRPDGLRLRGVIIVLWRAGLRISQALALLGERSRPSSQHRELPCRLKAAMISFVVGRVLPSQEEGSMPQVEVDGLLINYDVQGEGEPLLLIPYTSADHACYAFQLPAYTEQFSCIALDLPGSGESDKPTGPYSTVGYADQVAAFLAALGVESVHVAGVSLGAAVGMHLAARHPARVRSLSLHSGWHTTDDYLRVVVGQWRALASTLPTVADVVIQGIFPWCFTPEMYVERPEYVGSLEEFVRGRPAQPLDAFLAQVEGVLAHDASAVLGEIDVPTLITFGAHDLVCSTRFAEPLKDGIAASELLVFEHLSHAGLHEDPETFNEATLEFLLRQRS